MQIYLQEDKQKTEIEVTITYPEWSTQVDLIKNSVAACQKSLRGECDGRCYSIPIYEIYYVEGIERKTFLYTKEQVFRSPMKIYELLNQLPEKDFARISKSVILNLNVLESMIQLPNSKLEVTLTNQERLNVSRTYLSAIRRKLEEW